MNILLFLPQKSYSPEAVEFAGQLVVATRSSLHLLQVTKEKGKHDEGLALLQEIAERLSPSQPSSMQVAEGDMLEALEDVVDTHAINLVVLVTGTEVGLRARSLESTINKLVGHSPVPIIVVRKPTKKVERILVCTGGTPRAEDAIRAGAEFAKQLDAQAILLYVSNSVPSMYTGLDEMEETLQEILDTDTPLAHHLHKGAETLEKFGLEGKLELRHGVPFEAILAAIEEDDIDLVVVGASRVGRNVRNWLLGNVSKQVFERSPIPVMVVHLGHSIS